jgi:hypothetical protein
LPVHHCDRVSRKWCARTAGLDQSIDRLSKLHSGDKVIAIRARLLVEQSGLHKPGVEQFR